VSEATRSMRLGRRGFCAAVDHPVDRAARRRRIRTATIATCLLIAISLAELTWILVR
jgi:hypothetical protein